MRGRRADGDAEQHPCATARCAAGFFPTFSFYIQEVPVKSPEKKRRPLGSPVKVAIGFLMLVLPFIGCSVPGPGTSAAKTAIVYDAIPGILPPNMASVGFQATQTAEFGDYVHLAGANRALKSVTVTMSDWAIRTDYPSMPTAGWTHPISLSLCAVIPGAPLNQAGAKLGTVTQTFTIPWRPPNDPASPDGLSWKAGDGSYYHGLAFNITFDLASLDITLPNDVIICVAYNTQSYGAVPMAAPGPYNSLNVGVEGSATVGSDDNIDRVFWNTATAAWYADKGLAGVGIFREDTGWGTPSPNGTLPIQIKAAP
jgi:hypothetical protein